MNGEDWVELFVREMTCASDMDDASSRASRALGALEKSILAHTSSESSRSLSQENIMIREQVEALIQENTILKRAVSIQHERQREFEDKNQEVQHLKQMASQYQERLRTLENYVLTFNCVCEDCTKNVKKILARAGMEPFSFHVQEPKMTFTAGKVINTDKIIQKLAKKGVHVQIEVLQQPPPLRAAPAPAPAPTPAPGWTPSPIHSPSFFPKFYNWGRKWGKKWFGHQPFNSIGSYENLQPLLEK